MTVQRSQEAKTVILETADIGGTNTGSTGNWATWHDIRDFERIFAKLELGAWNAADDLDECRLQQASSSGGTGAKDLTTDGAGADYDTGSPVDADGDSVVLEARADQMDLDNGFNYVRVYAAEGGNTGVDNISGVLQLHGARDKKSELEAAAVSGATVYVTPS